MKKVLVFGERYFHYTDSAVYALEKIGFDVKVFYMPLIKSKNLVISEYIKYKLNKQDFQKVYYEKQKENIKAVVSDYRPDIFISINGNAYYEFVDNELLKLLKGYGCKSYLWCMDTIKRFESIEQNVCAFDGVWSFEPMDVKYIESKYSRKAKYLPIGVAEQIFCRGKDDKQVKYDISFVGNSTDNRLEVLDEVARYCSTNNKNMVVYGHYWHNKHWWQEYIARKKFAKKHPYLIKYVKNSFLHNNEVAELYNMSKVCLNIHISLHKGINPRTFEILGNGNFELCDYRADAESMSLSDGENIVLYKDIPDCLNKLDYYLQNEKERQKIADTGKRFVKQKYTLKKLLEDVLREEWVL